MSRLAPTPRRLLAGFVLLLLATLPIAIVPATAAGGSVDLTAQMQVASSSRAGSPFTYTITLASVGVDAADGATFQFTPPAGATAVALSCQGSAGGAACPTNLQVSNTSVTGTLPTMPRGGTVTLIATGNYPTQSSASATITVTPATGQTDSDPSSNTVTQQTALANTAKVLVTKTQDKETVTSGETRTYTVTYHNDGPADLINADLSDTYWPGGGVSGISTDWSITCDPSSTAACPSWANGTPQTKKTSGSMWLFAYSKATLHAGETLVLKVPVTTIIPCTSTGTIGVNNEAQLGLGTNTATLTGNATTAVQGTITCTDVSTNTTISTATPGPGGALTAAVEVKNAAGTATNVPITMTLPTVGFIVADGTVPTCTATGGAFCPTDLAYNAATNSVTGTASTIPAGGNIVITMTGHAGLVPPTTASYQITSTAPSKGDTSPAAGTLNPSSVTFSYANTQTTVDSVVNVTGLPASGAPAELVFTGIMTCTTHPEMRFALTVPAGSTQGTFRVTDKLWLHDGCTITLTEPTAPTGYSWGPWVDNGLTQTNITRPATFTSAISLIQQPVTTPTPTPSPAPTTPTPSPSVTPTPDVTPTPTPTPSVTPTPDVTPTPTPSTTATPTPSVAPTPTADVTPTPAPSATTTATPSPSVTPTPDVTPTPSTTATPTPSPSTGVTTPQPSSTTTTPARPTPGATPTLAQPAPPTPTASITPGGPTPPAPDQSLAQTGANFSLASLITAATAALLGLVLLTRQSRRQG